MQIATERSRSFYPFGTGNVTREMLGNRLLRAVKGPKCEVTWVSTERALCRTVAADAAHGRENMMRMRILSVPTGLCGHAAALDGGFVRAMLQRVMRR